MRTILIALAWTLPLAACGTAATVTPSPPTETSSPVATTVGSGSMTVTLLSVTTDTDGYRHAVLSLTVRGPLRVDTARCGGPAPVAESAYDSAGRQLADGLVYPQLCQQPTYDDIPAGATHTYSAQARWPVGSGTVVLHGHLSVVGASNEENVPRLTTH